MSTVGNMRITSRCINQVLFMTESMVQAEG